MQNRKITFFDWMITKLLGKPEDYSLEHRFFIAACFAAGSSGLLASIINSFLSLHPALIIITSGIAILYFIFYYISLKYKVYKGLILPYIFISLLTISYLWFLNSGSNGPIPYIIVTALLVYMVITHGQTRITAIAVVLITISVLYIWEYLYPEFIVKYPDAKSRFYDAYLTAVFSAGLVAFIASFIMKNYRDEREVVINQRDKIIEQNKEIRLTEMALRKSMEFNESIISNAQDGIVVLDLNCNFLLVNRAFIRICGHEEKTLVGQNCTELLNLTKDSKKVYLNNILKTSKTYSSEFEISNFNGSKLPVTLSSAYIYDEAGNPESIVAIVKDMTEYKKVLNELTYHKDHLEVLVKQRTMELEEVNSQLSISKEKAEESDRLKTAFLSNMSHEIRTPMNAIVGFSYLMKDPELGTETRNQYIDIITSKGNLLMHIINDIIDISKVEAGEMEIKMTACNVNHLMDELFTTFSKLQESAQKTGIDLRIVKPEKDEDVYICTDTYRIKQVLSNLIDNAIKFTHKGFVEAGYGIINEGYEKRLRFYVKDTGIGISSQNSDLIFTRFRQIDESHTREYGGTGLGLSISKKLVELLGGNLEMESSFGQGSSFYFSIPFLPADNLETLQSEHSEEIIEYNWLNKTLLVVEDNISGYILLQNYLKSTQVKLIQSVNGQDAVDICKSNPEIDLVLMDIQLPILNGFDATILIKKQRKNLPVIAVTAHALSEEIRVAKRAGFDDYLTKPIVQEKLLKTISKYFRY
jgi:PAS domain S-box-containing protein